jgi:hypothetical protein
VAGCCVCGDEPSGTGATDLVIGIDVKEDPPFPLCITTRIRLSLGLMADRMLMGKIK